jgi:nickel-dependent lactate racemase
VNFEYPYDHQTLSVEVDDRRVAGVLSPAPVPVVDARSILRETLKHPAGAPALADFLSGSKHPLCIVNDASRPSPVPAVLDAAPEIAGHPGMRFLVATGTHPAPDESGLAAIFGPRLEEVRGRIRIHDCRKDEEMAFIGRTPAGTEVRINRLAAGADRLVVIGAVEPHYFAGFTGGRKSFLPGCSAYATVEQNHRLALDRGSAVLALEGNPVHEDMEAAADLIPGDRVFSIQTVFDGEDRICAAEAGSLRETFRRAVRIAEAVYGVPAGGQAPAGIVVAVVSPPLDADLYQAHKALENAKAALRPGGVFILVASCRNGLGNDAFVRLLRSGSGPGAVIEAVRKEYRLGHHKSAKIAEFAGHSRLWAVTRLDPGVLESIFIRPFGDLQAALDAAFRGEPEARALFVRSAGTVVPVLRNADPEGRRTES